MSTEFTNDNKTICLTIDNSISMNCICSSNEKNYPRLELIRYACILIILSAKDGDEITLITFSKTTNVICEGTIIDDDTRLSLIDTIKSIRIEGSTNINNVIIKSFNCIKRRKNDNFTVHLFTDESNNGQVEKAIKPHYFITWRSRFLLSYQSSFFNLNCTNYKDNTPLFFISPKKLEAIRACEDIIRKTPIETNTTVEETYSYLSGPINSIYNKNGDSITGDSVFMTNEGLKRIDEFNNYTLVETDKGESHIKFLVRMEFEGNVYKVGNVKLTGYHPYRIENNDYFPIERNEGICYYKGYIYDLILCNRGNITSEDITVSCWGTINKLSSEEEKNSIFNHSYFSSERIVDDMRDLSNDQDEDYFLVDLFHCPQIRDTESNIVLGHDINVIKEVGRINKLIDLNKKGYCVKNMSSTFISQIKMFFNSFYGISSSKPKILNDDLVMIENGEVKRIHKIELNINKIGEEIV